MRKHKKLVTAVDIPLDVRLERETELHKMLQKHVHMWSGQLG